MEVTPELVEQLRQYANVSFADARAALEAADGDLLAALVWLEQQGKIAAAGVGSAQSDPNASNPLEFRAAEPQEGALERVWRWLTENRLECSKGERSFEVPLAVLIALVFFACYVVVLGVVLGFCFGWRFHFAGAELGSKKVNDVMDSIDDAAEELFRQVKDNFKQ